MKKLSNLRILFIVYFISRMIIDLVLEKNITEDEMNYLKISSTLLYTLTIIINVVLFLLGLFLFSLLLEKKNWARIVLLIIGWLAVLDFISSLFLSSKIAELFTYSDRPFGLDNLILIDRITDFMAIIFWGYTILILQFNNEVKKIFQSSSSIES